MKLLTARVAALERKRLARSRPNYIVQLDEEEATEQAYQRYVRIYGNPGRMIIVLPPDLTSAEWENLHGTNQ